MKNYRFYCVFLLVFASYSTFACTNLIVTRGASSNGSSMLGYTNDAEYIYRIYTRPSQDYKPGDSIEYVSRFGGRGKIPQVRHTYGIIGFHMNEHQVAIGETTFTGRLELWNKSAFLEYWHLMELALLRANTARQALQVIIDLVEKYGYASEGESISIIDPEEAWILEIVGTGMGGKGAIWVAMRIPDGAISAHANRARIGEFPLNDPQNCIYSKNVIRFAIERGYYNPRKDGPFRFNEVYCPATPATLRYCETRVWSIFRRAAPSLQLSPDYHRGVPDAERYPLWIVPDHPLSLQDAFELLRDHYEGTPFDMTQGLAAGPFGNPNRNRPLHWTVDSLTCAWERPISTFNTAFSFVAQARRDLSNEIGGVVWFGVDDTWFTCYFPIYCHNVAVSQPFATGELRKFSWESAWWVFNIVSNYANLRFSDISKEVRAKQHELESIFLARQDSIEQQAVQLPYKDRVRFLTDYSLECGNKVVDEWRSLALYLFTKYNDGYVKDSMGEPSEPGYPPAYYQKLVDFEGTEKYFVPEAFSVKLQPY
ncbi:MAG: dipeptidase [Bacteroidales bacterium]